MLKFILVALYILTLVGCSGEGPKELVLFDFETDAELNRMHWKCFTMFSLSDQYATNGTKSLKIELYPSNWPGWTPKLDENDWRRFEVVEFDVYNPGNRQVSMTVRIDDRKNYPDYGDRYNQSFAIKPGANSIRIPMKTLVTSGTRRNLDLKRIYRFMIFMGQPREIYTLYLDYVRLR